MQIRTIISLFPIFLTAFFVVRLSKVLIGKTKKTSDAGIRNNWILQSGLIGMCLGVGVGSALKEMFSEKIILLAGTAGAVIGVVIGIIIRDQTGA